MLYAPAAAPPTIVLPDFARSFSADGLIRAFIYKKTKTKAGKGLPQNAGLGVLPRGRKDFCGLMFGYFASKVK